MLDQALGCKKLLGTICDRRTSRRFPEFFSQIAVLYPPHTFARLMRCSQAQAASLDAFECHATEPSVLSVSGIDSLFGGRADGSELLDAPTGGEIEIGSACHCSRE